MYKCAFVGTDITWTSSGINLWTDSVRDVQRFIARLTPSLVYSPDEWETLISLNHRTPRLGWGKNQTSTLSNKSVWKPRVRPFTSCELFDETMVPTGHSGARGGTFNVLGERHPDVFTSSHYRRIRSAWVELRWELFFLVVIKSREWGKSTGSDSRCPRHPHTTPLSRQPKVKPPVRGSPPSFRVSFTKQATTCTVYTKQRVLPLGHHLKGHNSSCMISTCYLVKSQPNSGSFGVVSQPRIT